MGKKKLIESTSDNFGTKSNEHEDNYFLLFEENGVKMYQRKIGGMTYYIKKDKDNNEIYTKDCEGFETWYTYDEKNRMVYSKNSFGDENFFFYNENNNLHSIQYEGNIGWKKNQVGYNHNTKNPVAEYWIEFDEYGNESKCIVMNKKAKKIVYKIEKIS